MTKGDVEIQWLCIVFYSPFSKPWPWLYEFPLSACPRNLLMKLNSKQALKKPDIKMLVNVLYNDASLYEGGMYVNLNMLICSKYL